MENKSEVIMDKAKDIENTDVKLTEKLLLGILIFGAIINVGFFGVIFYNQCAERDKYNKMQTEIDEIKKDIHSLNFQASGKKTNTVIDKAINNKILEVYSKGFDNGYKCGYGFGYIDCHDGKPYSAEIPKE